MSLHRALPWLLVAASVLLPPAARADEGGTRLLRFPHLCGEQVVFTYGGDLWTAPVHGGTATRLTAGPGIEQSARFSPDCSRIAFTGQYSGDDQVHVVDAGGGEPVQLTWYPTPGGLPQRWGFDHQVLGWSPDGDSILFRSWRESHTRSNPRLFTVPASGGLPEALPMPRAGSGAWSPDGTRFVFSPKWRDFRTWNRYQGGWAQDLEIYDFKAASAQRLTVDRHTERDPMWIGDWVYFLSDRDGWLNLWRKKPDGGEAEQLTRHRDSDARWASSDGQGRIIWERDGRLEVFDTASGQATMLAITVPSDRVMTRSRQRPVKDSIEDAEISANGKRAVFTARGELFSVPLEEGLSLDLTHTPGAHEREASWSPDGRRVAYISDQSGEEAVWSRAADGSDARQLTQEAMGRLYAPRWSPDGKRIAFVDSDSRLRVVSASGGPAPVIADDPGFSRREHTWSPGGHYLAYTLTDPQTLRTRLYLRDFTAGSSRAVGGADYDAHQPVFSPDGKYLYFLADREWAPQISSIEWNYAANRNTGIYALALRRNLDNPFAPRNDSASADSAAEGAEGGDKNEGRKARRPEEIDDRIEFDGLESRLVRAPIEPDNIQWLRVTDSALLYVVSDAFYYGRDSATKPRLVRWTFKDRKSKELYTGIAGISLAADGKRALLRDGKAWKHLDPTAEKPEPKDVKLDGLFAEVDPKAEYAAIFAETWRRYRDHFYVANLHGYDWDALRARYEPMLQWVADRSDLNYLLGQMVAELNAGHAYVDGGDLGQPERPHVALLGATFDLDEASGRYRFRRILPGDNAEARYRSPLTEFGTRAEPGEYLLAINGRELKAPDSPWRLLQVAPGSLVQLTVARNAAGEGARTLLVQPLKDEQPLRYYGWTERNRAYVEQASDGRLGYLHIPDMGADGIREFIKWFYPQLRKQGLVLDVRDNGGGNVSAMIIERLRREVMAWTFPRGAEIATSYPQQTALGHLVAVANSTTASDGDIFSHMFQAAKLGPLVGTRTWGGVIGITSWGPAIDGGQIFVPQFGFTDPEGRFMIEGEGVVPDIEVPEDVAAEIAGRDVQLDRAIEELEKALQAAPVAVPTVAEDPVRTPLSR